MTLDQTIIQKASGENRLDPDQQRRYLGTFAERVVLLGTMADAHQPKLLDQLPAILQTYQTQYAKLQLKLSSKLDSRAELCYFKTAQDLGIAATIVDEDKASSPYGFVLHSDQAVNLDQVDVRKLYPELFLANSPKPEKTSFWKKIFG